MILASFFDPNSNGWDATDLATILGLVLAVAAILAVIRKVFQATVSKFASEVREIVRDEIKTYTKPIQKDANGGRSLPDANKKLDILAAHLGVAFPDSLQVKE